MTRRPRRNHSPVFKAKVAIAAIKGEKTMIELSQELDIYPNQIKQWRDQLRGRLLPAAPGQRRGSDADEPDRPAASGSPLRGQPDVAGHPGSGRLPGWPQARSHTDETDGDRRAVSQAEYHETSAGAQNLPLSAAETADHPTQSGLGHPARRLPLQREFQLLSAPDGFGVQVECPHTSRAIG